MITDTILLLVMLLIAAGLDRRDAFALRWPRSWADSGRVILVVIGLAYVESGILGAIYGPEAREQAMPIYWDGTRAGAYVASLFALGVYVPFVEEMTCRGIGFRLLEAYGPRIAVGGSALAFALMHGAVIDFPWVLTLGLGAGFLRWRSGSLYPSMLLHGTINGVAVIAAAAAAAG